MTGRRRAKHRAGETRKETVNTGGDAEWIGQTVLSRRPRLKDIKAKGPGAPRHEERRQGKNWMRQTGFRLIAPNRTTGYRQLSGFQMAFPRAEPFSRGMQ
jgi:hypothetical protein